MEGRLVGSGLVLQEKNIVRSEFFAVRSDFFLVCSHYFLVCSQCYGVSVVDSSDLIACSIISADRSNIFSCENSDFSSDAA